MILLKYYVFGTIIILLFTMSINRMATTQFLNQFFRQMLLFIALWPIALPIILLMPRSVIERLANDNRR